MVAIVVKATNIVSTSRHTAFWIDIILATDSFREEFTKFCIKWVDLSKQWLVCNIGVPVSFYTFRPFYTLRSKKDSQRSQISY